MNLYESQFLDIHDQPTPQGEVRTLLIASTPRCGSHMVGHAMMRTGQLGVPFEYCNRANMAEWMRRLEQDTPEATLAALMARRSTANGIFGIKCHYEHGAVLGGADNLIAALPNVRVVHLRRADVLRQAISFAIARQTGVWIDGQVATSDTAIYDRGLIADCLEEIAVQNALWTSLFKECGIQPLEITYEDAVQDIGTVINSIARFAGVIGPDQNLCVRTQTKRQSQPGRTNEWVERFADERQHRQPVHRRIGGRVRRVVLGGRSR